MPPKNPTPSAGDIAPHLMNYDDVVGPGKFSRKDGPWKERANYNDARGNTAKFASSAMPMDVTERGIEKQNQRVMRQPIKDMRQLVRASTANMMDDMQQYTQWLDKAFPHLGPASKQRILGELAPTSAFARARSEAEDVAMEEQMHWLQLLKDTKSAQPKLKENILRFQQAHDTPDFRAGEATANKVMGDASRQGAEMEDLQLMLQSMESPTRVTGGPPNPTPPSSPQTPLTMPSGGSSMGNSLPISNPFGPGAPKKPRGPFDR